MIETKRNYLLYFQDAETLDALDLTKVDQAHGRFCTTFLRNPRLFCYSPSRDQLSIPSHFSCYELPNTLYKIICERSKQLGKVQALLSMDATSSKSLISRLMIPP
jgi:hypothetical protein